MQSFEMSRGSRADQRRHTPSTSLSRFAYPFWRAQYAFWPRRNGQELHAATIKNNSSWHRFGDFALSDPRYARPMQRAFHQRTADRHRSGTAGHRDHRHRGIASWSGAEIATILIFAVVSMPVIAIFLGPEQLGKAAIVGGVIGIIEVACCTGWHDALVRMPSIHNRLTDSAHTVICFTAVAAALALAVAAENIARLFGDNSLKPLLLAGAVSIPLCAATIVPSAILARKFRARAISTRWIIHRTAAFIVTLGLASLGAGAMSIVAGSIAANLASVLVLLQAVRWPRFILLWNEMRAELRPVLRYAGGISAETLLSSGVIRIFNLLAGWLYGTTGAGYFQLSQRIVDETAVVFQSLIARYSLAHFARLARTGRDPNNALLIGSTIAAYVSLPIFGAFAVCADDIVHVVFGEGWKGAAVMLRFCAIGWMLAFPVQFAIPLLRAAGKQAKLTLYASASALLAVAALLAMHPLGMWSVGAAWGARHLPAIPFFVVMTSLLLGIPVWHFARVLFRPAVAVALTVGAVELLTPHLPQVPILRLLSTLGVGALTYVLFVSVLDWSFVRVIAAQAILQLPRNMTPIIQQEEVSGR